MSNVVDLDDFRRRRGVPPRSNEDYADLIRASQVEWSVAVTRELDRIWDQLTIESVATPPPLFRRAEPPVVVDETQLWTADNPGWRALADAIDWTDASPERTAEVNRVLRILHSTDQGSDRGDAESHRGDPPPAR